MIVILFFFFFFQAEDGIRDLTVTGVQTCALPIWLGTGGHRLDASPGGTQEQELPDYLRCMPTPILVRSEEHTSELQSQSNLVCRLLLEKKKQIIGPVTVYITPQSYKCWPIVSTTS